MGALTHSYQQSTLFSLTRISAEDSSASPVSFLSTVNIQSIQVFKERWGVPILIYAVMTRWESVLLLANVAS